MGISSGSPTAAASPTALLSPQHTASSGQGMGISSAAGIHSICSVDEQEFVPTPSCTRNTSMASSCTNQSGEASPAVGVKSPSEASAQASILAVPVGTVQQQAPEAVERSPTATALPTAVSSPQHTV